MHTRGAATPTAPNRAFRGTNQTQTPGLQGLGQPALGKPTSFPPAAGRGARPGALAHGCAEPGSHGFNGLVQQRGHEVPGHALHGTGRHGRGGA